MLRRLSYLLVFLIVAPAWANEELGSAEEQLVNCAFYRSKRDGVPVYRKADRSSRVLRKLELGEYICHIGARGEFAILDWTKQDLINKKSDAEEAVEAGIAEKTVEEEPASSDSDEIDELAYVRLVDLWKDNRQRPSDLQPKDFISQAKEHLNSIGGSLAPDDVYGPLRPIIDVIHPPTKCRAGKEICDKVEKELQEQEEKGLEDTQ